MTANYLCFLRSRFALLINNFVFILFISFISFSTLQCYMQCAFTVFSPLASFALNNVVERKRLRIRFAFTKNVLLLPIVTPLLTFIVYIFLLDSFFLNIQRIFFVNIRYSSTNISILFE